MERFLTTVYNNPKGFGLETYSGPEHIRYITSKSLESQYMKIEPEIIKLQQEADIDPSRKKEISEKITNLLKDTIKPDREFDYEGVKYLDKIPVWFGRTIKDLKLFVGPKDLDMSQPCCMTIGDDNPHSNAQGATGAGKTVLIHELIFNLLLLYPPWELDLILIDNKMAEMHLYGNTVKTPHCETIALTNSKEFLLDLYKSIAQENERRQALFSVLDVDGVKALRKKYDLVMPTKLLIVDELVSMITAIENTASEGNTNVSEEKKIISNSMANIATKGRNAKVHMFISSQDLGPKLDQSISGQLKSGISLQGDSGISRSCIGNTEASEKIDRKGMCIMNEFRLSQNNESKNVISGVPFLDKDSENGEYSAPNILYKLADMSREYQFDKELYYYNANTLIPKYIYDNEIKTIKNSLHTNKQVTQCIIPLGKEINYLNPVIVKCTLNYRTGDGFFIDSKTEKQLKYMFNIILYSLQEQLGETGLRTTVYSITDQTSELLELSKKINVGFQKVKNFPKDVLRLYNNRLLYIKLSEWLSKNKSASEEDMYRAIVTLFGLPNLTDCESLTALVKGTETNEKLAHEVDALSHIYINFCNLYQDENIDSEGILSPCAFKPILNFWFDIQEADDILDIRKEVGAFFINAAKVNIINVVNCSNWSNERFTDSLTGACRYVLEYSLNQVYKSLGLGPFSANVNSDSLILHDRLKKGTHFFIKNFGGIN